MRYKFGPQIVGTYPRPDVPGELPDVGVTASIKSYRAGAPGEIDLDVSFQVPPFDPATSTPIAEFHAMSFAAGHGIPTDPAMAIAAAVPKAIALPTVDLSRGAEVIAVIKGSPTGLLTIVTVLGYADPIPAAPAPVAS